MLKIRDLGINVIPVMGEYADVYEQYLDTMTYDKGAKRAPATKKPATKKPATKKPTKKKPAKKPSKKGYKTSGFSTDAVTQLKRQLEERIGAEH
jgi:hypothetical protein